MTWNAAPVIGALQGQAALPVPTAEMVNTDKMGLPDPLVDQRRIPILQSDSLPSARVKHPKEKGALVDRKDPLALLVPPATMVKTAWTATLANLDPRVPEVSLVAEAQLDNEVCPVTPATVLDPKVNPATLEPQVVPGNRETQVVTGRTVILVSVVNLAPLDAVETTDALVPQVSPVGKETPDLLAPVPIALLLASRLAISVIPDANPS